MRRRTGLILAIIFAYPLSIAAHAQPSPAEIRSEWKKSIEAAIQSCGGSADAEGAFGSTVGELVTRFSTLSSLLGPCKWSASVGNEIETAQLAAAAKEVATDLSANGQSFEKEFAKRVIGRIDELLAYVRVGGDPPRLERYEYQKNTTKTLGQTQDAIDALQAALKMQNGAFDAPWLGRYPTGSDDIVSRLGAGADQRCDDCRSRIRRLIRYLPVFAAIDTATLPIARQDWSKLRDVAARNEARWDAYHFGGGWDRVQLPWELAINGWIYQSFIEKRPEDREGDLPGSLAGPPNWALVVGHPSIGITPFDDKGANSPIAGVVETVGVSWWDYDSATNNRKNEFGLSLAAVYQERDSGKDWSPGLVLRLPYNGINVVWSRVDVGIGGEQDVFAFSIDPTSLFKGNSLQCLFGLSGCEK